MPTVGEIKHGTEIGRGTDRCAYFVWVSCENCGKERWVRVRHGVPRNKTALCSKCYSSIMSAARVRDLHPRWRGRWESEYIKISSPEHHRADKRGYVFEHILVWEQTHNKVLPDGWLVHHVNGIKLDNRPRNLFAMPKGKHHSGLALTVLKERIRELEVDNKLLEKALDNSQMIFRVQEN